MSDTSVVGTPDIIFVGIRFDVGSTYLPIYLQQIMFQNTIFHARDSVKCLQHHLILFFCALSMIKDGEVFGSSAVIFCVICNIFCAFDLGNLTLPLLVLFDLPDEQSMILNLKNLCQYQFIQQSCVVLEGFYLWFVSQSDSWVIWTVVFIAADLGIPVPDAHALNLFNRLESLEKGNSDLWTSLPPSYKCQLISKFSL